MTDVTVIVKAVIRGVGQIMFQESAGTGLAFLIGIAIASPWLAAGALLGSAIGTAAGWLLRYDRSEIHAGLHGFNPALVGIALPFYLKSDSIWTWLVIVAACGLCVPIAHIAKTKLSFPTYTFPFIITTWLTLSLVHEMAGNLFDTRPASPQNTPEGFVDAVFSGLAEVMFGASVLTGACFFAGIAINDWRLAVVALAGSAAGTALAVYHHDPAGSVGIGIYGYNAALAAMAIYLRRPGILIPMFAALITVPLTEFFPKMPAFPSLTFPFVLASWAVQAMEFLEHRYFEASGLDSES